MAMNEYFKMNTNYSPIILSAAVQQLYEIILFQVLLSTVWNYYLAVDKGVKKISFVIVRYGFVTRFISSFIANLIRSIVIIFIISISKVPVKDVYDYIEIGLLVGVVSILFVSSSLRCQRPIPQIIIFAYFQVSAAVLASTALFYAKDIQIQL